MENKWVELPRLNASLTDREHGEYLLVYNFSLIMLINSKVQSVFTGCREKKKSKTIYDKLILFSGKRMGKPYKYILFANSGKFPEEETVRCRFLYALLLWSNGNGHSTEWPLDWSWIALIYILRMAENWSLLKRERLMALSLLFFSHPSWRLSLFV